MDPSKIGELHLQATCYAYVLRLRSALLKLPIAKIRSGTCTRRSALNVTPKGSAAGTKPKCPDGGKEKQLLRVWSSISSAWVHALELEPTPDLWLPHPSPRAKQCSMTFVLHMHVHFPRLRCQSQSIMASGDSKVNCRTTRFRHVSSVL